MYRPLKSFATTKHLFTSNWLLGHRAQSGCGEWRLIYSGLKYVNDDFKEASARYFSSQKSVTLDLTNDLKAALLGGEVRS